MLYPSIFIKLNLKYRFLHFNIHIGKSNHPAIPSYSRVSRRHQLLSPNPLPLFYSSSPATDEAIAPIRHICDFSCGVLNVRFMREHPTLAPRPQIWLMKFTGFCTVAGEDELNRKWEDLGDRSRCLLLTRE